MLRVGALLAGALLASTVAAKADPVALDLWTVDNEGEYHFVLAKEFEKLHPDIKVNVKHILFSDMISNLARAVATGEGPDVTYIDNPEVPLFASRGLLLDLDPLIADSKIIKVDDIFPGPRSSVTWDGKVYGIPRGANTIALFYNADMFKAKGLDPDKPPGTWDELYAAAKTLSDPAKNVYGLAFSAVASEEGTFQFLPWAQMTGASYEKISTPGAVRALNFWARLIDEKLASPATLIHDQREATASFNAGNAAMVITGPWLLPRMAKDARFDFRVTMLPTETAGGTRASALGEGDNVILASSRHPKEAFELIEFFYSRMPIVWNEFGFLPAYTVDARDPKWPAYYAVFVESMKFARNRGPNPEWPKISKAIQTAIQSTLTRQSDATTALAVAQAEIDAIIRK